MLNLLALELGSFQGSSEEFTPDPTQADVLTTLESIISNIIGFVTILAGIFFIVYFILGAFNWMTSGGDSGKVASARNRIMQAVIGLTLVVASYAIIGVITGLLGIDILNLGDTIESIIPGQSQESSGYINETR